MLSRPRVWASACLAFFSAFSILSAQQEATSKPAGDTPQALFRSETLRVPVDVVVLDKKGRPVLDLAAGDFEVFENEVPREIVNFSLQQFGVARRSQEAAGSAQGDLQGPAETASAGARTFLIALGRVPNHSDIGTYFKSMDRLVEFVEDLRPPDRIAVMAYNRITDFGQDIDKVAALLRDYQKTGPRIESVLTQRFSHQLFASQELKRLPPKLRQQADEMFKRSGLRSRQVVAPFLISTGQRKEENREAVRLDTLDVSQEMFRQRDTIERGILSGAADTQNRDPVTDVLRAIVDPPDPAQEARARREHGGTFESARLALISDIPRGEYLSRRVTGDEDLNTIFSAIEYLRFIADEKHLIFMTPQGLLLPQRWHYEEVGRMASNYRIRIHAIQTGNPDYDCVDGGTQSTFNTINDGLDAQNPLLSTDRNLGCGNLSRTDALAAIRRMSSMTGGQSFIHRDIERALSDTERSARASYLLGYEPVGEMNGGYRSIKVHVKRPGLKVLARQGYYARPRLDFENQEKLKAYVRTVAAANTERPLQDISANVEVQPGQTMSGKTAFRVDLDIDFAAEMVARQDNRLRGSLVVAYFFGDDKKDKLWPVWDRIQMDLSDQNFQRVSREGIRLQKVFHPPIRVDNGWLKVVIYDPANDRVGTLSKRIYASAGL
ncbi:MAG TPA: VWA domain-containing protein [Acidobacteriota bacterium]|nr:VWA domain-containing protein [Acidobacteriota bacterium]